MNITDAGFQIEAPLALPEDEVQLRRVDLEASDVTFNVSHSCGIALFAFKRRREIGV